MLRSFRFFKLRPFAETCHLHSPLQGSLQLSSFWQFPWWSVLFNSSSVTAPCPEMLLYSPSEGHSTTRSHLSSWLQVPLRRYSSTLICSICLLYQALVSGLGSLDPSGFLTSPQTWGSGRMLTDSLSLTLNPIRTSPVKQAASMHLKIYHKWLLLPDLRINQWS